MYTLRKALAEDPWVLRLKLNTIERARDCMCNSPGDGIAKAVFINSTTAQRYTNHRLQKHNERWIISEWARGYMSEEWLDLPFSPKLEAKL